MSTILIIDDREPNREYLSALLGYSDHRVLQASDGEEGLALALAERPNLVITDILMPTMDGYEFVRRLRAEPCIAATPVIFLTAHYHDREARSLADACGVSHVLIKPAEPEAVLAAVAETLGEAAPEPVSVPELEFDREHLRLITDKLSEKANELRRTNEQLAALVDLGLRLGSEKDPGRLIQSVCSTAREILGARFALVGTYTPDGSQMRHLAASGPEAEQTVALQSQVSLDGVFGQVVRDCHSVRLTGAQAAALEPVLGAPSPPRSVLIAPIASPTRVYGWLLMAGKLGAEEFSEEDERLAGIIGAQTGRVYENGSLYADLLDHTGALAQEVEERKRAEEERDRFFTQSLDLLCVAGFDGFFKRVNPTFEATLGYSNAELLGRPFLELIHPKDRAPTLRRVMALSQGEATISFEIRCLRREGGYRWVEWNATPFLDQHGFYASGHDITVRKEAEAALAERVRQATLVAELGVALALRAPLREVLEHCVASLAKHLDAAFVRIWTLNEPDQTLVLQATTGGHADIDVSDRRVRLGEHLVGKIAAERKSLFTNDLPADALLRNEDWVRREQVVAFAGHPLMVGETLVGVVTLYSRNPFSGASLDCLATVTNQIALGVERKWADEALTESGKRLRAAQERLERVVGSSPAVLYTLSIEESHPTWCSANILEMLGYSLEEAYAPNWWTSNLHPEDLPRVGDEIQELLQSEGRLANEFRMRRRDGTYRWIRNEMRLLLDDSGTPQEVVGSWTDITERRLLEDQFRQSQKMEAIGRLAGGVAHDFNNLLSVIIGYSDLLRMRMSESDPNFDMAGEMGSAAKRAASLTRQLLAFSRKAILKPTNLDLTEVVGNMEKMLRRIIGEDIQLLTLADSPLGIVKADAGHIEQVVLNLAVNARDAMPRGGQLAIEVRNKEVDETLIRRHPEILAGRYVMISVSDTGCGMDEETLTRIWEPFFSTKGESGTGLGLATVYGIIQQSGGLVSVQSEVGVGTTFELYLPRVDEPAPEAMPVSTQNAMPGGTETLLLVEDEEAVRVLTSHVLQSCGYQVLEAKDAAEALRITQAFPGRFDLLVTDVVMPRMGGPELAERIRELQPGLKALFVSGYTDDAVLRHGVLTDKMHFLAKPFYPSALARKVREVLDGG